MWITQWGKYSFRNLDGCLFSCQVNMTASTIEYWLKQQVWRNELSVSIAGMCYISLFISLICLEEANIFVTTHNNSTLKLLLPIVHNKKGFSQTLCSVCAWKRRQQHPVPIETHLQNGKGYLTFSHLSNSTEDVCGTEQVRGIQTHISIYKKSENICQKSKTKPQF